MNRWLFLLLVCAATGVVGCDADLGNEAAEPDPPDAAPAPDSPLPCPANDPMGQLTAFRTDGAITVDGALDESTWQSARSVEFTSTTGRSDNQVEVWMAWSDDQLYLAYHVIDQQLETNPDDDENNQVHRDDGAELYLDTAHNATMSMDADDYHFIVNIDGDIDLGVSGPFEVATVPLAGGYTMELGIPWTQAGGAPQAEQTMGMLLGNNDRDNGDSAQFDWTGVITMGNGSYARPNLWGDLKLAAALADGSCQ